MNRNNIWIHIGIAVVIVTLAAVLGQIRRWESSLRPASVSVDKKTSVLKADAPVGGAKDAELLVRFKPGVTVDQIKQIALRNNDVMEDEYEEISGLVAIDDLETPAEHAARRIHLLERELRTLAVGLGE